MHFSDGMFPFSFSTTIVQVKACSPAQGALLRGDIIVKIQEYDARDIRNIDAKTLFRSADNRIRVVVQRDNKLIVSSNMSNQKSRSPSAVPPYRPDINLLHYDFNEAANLLPQTSFQPISDNGSSQPHSRISNFSPMPTRDHQQEVEEEKASITSQVSISSILISSFDQPRPRKIKFSPLSISLNRNEIFTQQITANRWGKNQSQS